MVFTAQIGDGVFIWEDLIVEFAKGCGLECGLMDSVMGLTLL